MSSRREFLGGVAALTAATGCDRVVGALSRSFGGGLPESIRPPDGETVEPAHHLLSRAAFGPWPGDVERVRSLGAEAWLDEQLDPSSIDDTAAALRTSFIDGAHLDPAFASELRPEYVEQQLATYTLLTAIYSKRQLLEVMVGFFRDHFNIAIGKSPCQHLKPSEERDVLRAHALGSFRALLKASATSPAMLVYLDGRDNKSRGPQDKPNENYARELLELYTLGVDAGYTQRDVMEAARCLTGWVVRDKWAFGKVEFVSDRHDDGEKLVLGRPIPAGGGAADLDRLLDILVDHPACGRFIATKLCRWFVADVAPQGLVTRAAATFRAHRSAIAPVVRTILTSPEFGASVGQKLKRPFRFVVSSLRALGAETNGRHELGKALEQMGQGLFHYPTPDGYSHRAEDWYGTLHWRWAFALALVSGRVAGTRVQLPALTRALGSEQSGVLLRHLYGRRATRVELEALASVSERASPELVALALSSPAFQRH